MSLLGCLLTIGETLAALAIAYVATNGRTVPLWMAVFMAIVVYGLICYDDGRYGLFFN